MNLRSYLGFASLGCALIVATAQQPTPYSPPAQVPQTPQLPPQLPRPIDTPPIPHSVDTPATQAAAGSASASRAYSARWFVAIFNGPVTVEVYDDRNVEYRSIDGNVSQRIFAHQETKDGALDYTTTDLHAARYASNVGTVVGDKVHGSLKGHPYTYEKIRSTEKGQQFTYRVMYVAVNARTQLRILQIAPMLFNDKPDWLYLLHSITIR